MKFKEIFSYVLIVLVVIIVRSFIITPVIVSGTSMEPTLDNKDMLLLKKYDKKYERYDIVVFKYQNSKLVKRIIGLPGETVEYKNGVLYINDEEIEDRFSYVTNDYELDTIIPEGYYFVLGDNRNNSSDSRIIGLVSENQIDGATTFSLWPFKKINK